VNRTNQPLDNELVRFFDLSLDLFCIAGFDGFFKHVNRAFERALGYSEEELLGRPFLDLVHADDRRSSRDVLAELALGNNIVGFENRVICADGSVRWLEWNTRARQDQGFVYGVARDVTDRHMANAELNALRRVAILVAEGVEPEGLLAVVAEEVARVVDVPLVNVARYEVDGTASVCASFSAAGPVFPIGQRWPLAGTHVLRLESSGAALSRIRRSGACGRRSSSSPTRSSAASVRSSVRWSGPPSAFWSSNSCGSPRGSRASCWVSR
jgi:PAS domain S-box-containing protein